MVSIGSAPFIADDALVDALRDGDEAAFEEIFRRYYVTVYGIVLRLTGSPEEAEDLVQDVFMQLHERPPSGSYETSNISGWLYRVATNSGLNAVRSRSRRRDRLMRWARLERPLRSVFPSAETEAEQRDEIGAIRLALSHLSTRDQTVLVLRHSGVSYAEIAEIVNLKPGSVGTILARAERALRMSHEWIERERKAEEGAER